MTVGVGAAGVVGIAIETVSGTYTAPTTFLSLRNESLNYKPSNISRRPLRGTADVTGLIAGYVEVGGDIEVEVTPDHLPVILRAARLSQAVTGTTPKVYTTTPTNVAVPAQTLSITVVRNGIVFGYTGCVVGSQKYSLADGLLVATFSILGRDEAVQSVPTPTWSTERPFGPGEYDIQVPTASSVLDTDTFELSIEDNAESQFRLKNTGRGAQFIKYGERSVELTMERDFESRTEYDAFKAMTAQGITIMCSQGVNSKVQFKVPAAIKDSYEIAGNSGQADLIRASIKYMGVLDSVTGKSYEIVTTTTATITVP